MAPLAIATMTMQIDLFPAYPTETPEESFESAMHLQALAVIEELAVRFPDNEVYVDAYTAALCRISGLFSYTQFNKIDYSRALAEKALSVAKQNAAQHPEKPRYLRHVISASRLLAGMASRFPEYLQDIDYLYDALEDAKQLDAAEPGEPTNITLVASTHSAIAILELQRGNRALADEHQAEALSIMETACRSFPDYSALKITIRDLSVWYEQELEKLGISAERENE